MCSNKFFFGYILYENQGLPWSSLWDYDKHVDVLNLVKSIGVDEIEDYYSYVIDKFLVYCFIKFKKHKFYLLLGNIDNNKCRKMLKNIIMTIDKDGGLTKKILKCKFESQLKKYKLKKEWTDYTILKFVGVYYDFLSNLGQVSCFIKNSKLLLKNDKNE